jgi:hypothetical protein
MPMWRTLLVRGGRRQGETRDASPNDQDPLNVRHVVPPSHQPSKSFGPLSSETLAQRPSTRA